MPRSFAASFESPVAVQDVYAAFGSGDYWLDRLAAFGGGKCLDSLVCDGDGTVTVEVTEDLRRGALPGILSKLYRGDFKVCSTEIWRPDSTGRLHGKIAVAVLGAPGSGSGTAVVAPSKVGSRLDLSATVEFNVPLVGGKVEGYVASQFVNGFADIDRFTTDWITQRV